MEDRTGTRAPFGAPATFAGAVLLALFALWFLRGALADLEGGILSAADASQVHPLLAVDAGVRPANPALEPVWRTQEAWRAFASERLSHSVLPTWNGLNAGGTPFLANPRTGVFSPISWPHVVLPPAWAAWIAAFAKLFTAGFATFLFLRELRLAFAAALLGSVLFMFSGSEAARLLEAHTATAFVLPLGLFLVERLARATERRFAPDVDERALRRAIVRTSIALVLALSAAFFGGAIDTFLFGVAIVATWTLVRFVELARSARGAPRARRALRTSLGCLFGVGVVTLLLCAVQGLPYLEFLGEARPARPSGREGALPPWPLVFFPASLGSPASWSWIGPELPRPGWSTLAWVSTGALSLVLALFGFSASRNSRTAWFFVLAGLAGTLLGFGLLGSDHLQWLFPSQTTPVVESALFLLPFAVGVLAALAVDHVAGERPLVSPIGTVAVFAAGAAVLIVARGAALRTLERIAADPDIQDERVALVANGSAHIEFVVATALVGLGLFALAAAWRERQRRVWLLLALAPVVYAECGAGFEGYQPLARQLHHFTRTPDLARRDGTVGLRGSIVLGAIDVPADVNAIFGLRSVFSGGPLRVRRYDQLFEQAFEPRGEPGVVTHASRHALDLFGIECVFDADGWVDVDTTLAGTPPRRATWRESDEILAGTPVATYFTMPADGAQALRFPWVTRGIPNTCELSVTVDDLDTGTRLCDTVFPRETIRPAGRQVVDCVLPFPHEARVAGHALVLRVRAGDDAVLGRSWAVGFRTDLAALLPGARTTQGERVQEGVLALDVAYARDEFARQDRVGPFDLWRRDRGASRFRTVGTARIVDDDGASWSLALDPAFDPRTEVVLEGAPRELARTGPASDEEGASVEVVDDVDGRVRLIVKRKTSGFVVTPIAWYPGWRARVNGGAQRTLCANYAFTAVAVPAGESLVELEYAPKSLRNGLILSIAGIACLLVAFAGTLPPERGRAERA